MPYIDYSKCLMELDNSFLLPPRTINLVWVALEPAWQNLLSGLYWYMAFLSICRITVLTRTTYNAISPPKLKKKLRNLPFGAALSICRFRQYLFLQALRSFPFIVREQRVYLPFYSKRIAVTGYFRIL